MSLLFVARGWIGIGDEVIIGALNERGVLVLIPCVIVVEICQEFSKTFWVGATKEAHGEVFLSRACRVRGSFAVALGPYLPSSDIAAVIKLLLFHMSKLDLNYVNSDEIFFVVLCDAHVFALGE